MRIENQAMMFALLAKHAIETCGEQGREVIQEGMIRYGRERGARMAKNAVSNGDPIALWTNQAYGEWKPDYDGQMTFGYVETEPVLVSYISKCAWCEAWQKYDILEYGREYCVNVDKAVYEGFCKDYVCTPLGDSMSFGGGRCEFDWGQPLSAEDQAKLQAKKAEIGTKYMKDFTFHTAHIYHTITDVIRTRLPEQAESIIVPAVEEYIDLFGREEYDPIFDFSKEDF